MNLKSVLTDVLPKSVNYKLAYKGWIKPTSPINITISATNICQSRCKTCNIYQIYKKEFNSGCFSEGCKSPKDELTLEEYEKFFKTVGHVYFVNMSGGEPSLRKDFADIVELANKYMTPAVIHTPTNALLPEKIRDMAEDILQRLQRSGRDVPFTIKPSFDGVGPVHDFVRGIPGNFEKLMQTYELLRPLKERYPNFEIGAGTVISNFNIDKVEETAKFVHQMKLDSYINEVAELRSEMFNIEEPITPSWDKYKEAIEIFKRESKRNWNNAGSKVGRYTQAFRLVYYDLVVEILRRQTQVLPCYGGVSNVHISPYGDVWPCAILGYEHSFGNIRDWDYDFKKVWYSDRASEVRKYIREKRCWCPLANQSYSNILCNPTAMFKVFANMLSASKLGDTSGENEEEVAQSDQTEKKEQSSGSPSPEAVG